MSHQSTQHLADRGFTDNVLTVANGASGAMTSEDALEAIARNLMLDDFVHSALVFEASLSERGKVRLQGVDPRHRRIDTSTLEDALNEIRFFEHRDPYLDQRSTRKIIEKLAALGWQTGATSRVIALRFIQGAHVYGGAFIQFDPQFSSRVRRNIPQAINTANTFLASLRKANAPKLSERPPLTQNTLVNLAAEMADAHWESGPDGCIRRIVLLNASARTKMLRALEGKSLFSLLGNRPLDERSGDELKQIGRQKVRVNLVHEVPSCVEICGERVDGDHWIGLARIMDNDVEQATNARFARDLTNKLNTARQRETDVRAEIEGLLDCLLILTQVGSERGTFGALLTRVLVALEAEAGIILQRDWSGRINICCATNAKLRECAWAEESAELFFTERTKRISPDQLSALEGTSWRSGLLIRLNDGPQPAVLLCLHHAIDHFGQRQLGTALRLSLVTHQAFLIEEERQKVIQSSKLASLGEMTAGIAHEITQPLSAIRLGVQSISIMLETKGRDAGQLQTIAGRLEKQIERLGTTVQSMRNLSRRADVRSNAFMVAEAIGEALSLLQYKLRQHDLRIKLDISTDLQIFANRIEFGQVALNLVNNSIDALGALAKTETRHSCDIEIVARKAGEELIMVRVRDYGPGFSQGYLERAFEPFVTTKDVGKGTGLGLSLCRQMIANMSGDIKLRNWESGAEVELTLPSGAPFEPHSSEG